MPFLFLLENLFSGYDDYQLRLKEGVITTDDDLRKMEEIKKEVTLSTNEI